MQWEAIHWAVNNGFLEYNLGEVSDDNEKLASFKTKWGVEERQLYHYYYPQRQVTAKGTDSLMLSSYQKLLGRVWRHMPLRITACLGDLIYRYL